MFYRQGKTINKFHLNMENLTDTSTTVVRFRSGFIEMFRAISAIDRLIPHVRRIRFLAKCAFVLNLGVFVAIVLLESPPSWLNIVFGFFILFPAIVFVTRWASPAYVAWLTRNKNKIWQNERVLTFSAAGIEFNVDGLQSFSKWESVVRVEETKTFTLFFISDRCGYFIPRRVFSSTADYDRFMVMLRTNAGRESMLHTSVNAPRNFTGSPKLSISFEYSVKELSRAISATARHGGILRMWYFFLVVLSVWSMGPHLYRLLEAGTADWMDLIKLVPGIALVIFLLVLQSLSSRLQARRWVRTNKCQQGNQCIELYDEGLATSGALYNSQINWSVFGKVIETREFFLFFMGKAQSVLIPKRVVRDGDMNILRALIMKNLGDRATLFSN